MNYRLLYRMLGYVSLLIGVSMLFSLPFAIPGLSYRRGLALETQFETKGALALLSSISVSVVVGLILLLLGRKTRGQLYRKEAMAVVGLSWIMATVLGALPFYLAAVEIEPGREITFIESMFEAQSGFSTTGATVITDLESPELVPCCILFWRSSTHFLGGLGIVVLFVAILGQGSAGKAMMRAEMPGPSKEGSMPRMQQTALAFAGIYVSLNLILTAIYMLEGMTLFDGLCHAFGTMATGGFSTYNASIAHFDSIAIEYTTIIFMIIGGTNFTLMYLVITRHSIKKLLNDLEFRTYLAVLGSVTFLIVMFGHFRYHDPGFETLSDSIRNGLFQVVSVMTTTGYATADFDRWNNFARGVLLVLMFVGGCAGSTGGGMKVIRHVLFYKILQLELERAHHPRVVRPLTIGGVANEDPDLPRNILVYFGLILGLFVASWLLLITFEPDSTWGVSTDQQTASLTIEENATAIDLPTGDRVAVPPMTSVSQTLDQKLLDLASAVSTTLNNVGPGLGVVGPTRNFAPFSQGAKLLFTLLMMLGRVEVFSIIVLLMPGFWYRY